MATQTGDKQADSVNEALKSINENDQAANTQNKQSVTKQDSIVSGSKLADNTNPEEKTKTSADKKEKVVVDGNNEKGADGGSNLIAK